MQQPTGSTDFSVKSPKSNPFIDLFARIWALWGIISFIGSFLVIFLPSMAAYLFPDKKKGQDYFIWVSRCWMTCWLHLVGCPVKVFGKHHFAAGETYVVVYNHNALLDVPLSAPFIPGGNKTIAKASFAKVPIFGFFYRRGSVLVDRNSDKSRRKSFDEMKQALANGMHMCLYPEGTRNRTPAPMKPFYDGAFKLAIDAKKQIIPGVIIGTNRAMPIHKSFYLLPTPLKMIFLPPVAVENMDAKALKEKIFNQMVEVFTKEQKIN